MSSAIVNASANRISALLSEEVKFLYDVKNKVERLQRELRMAHSFLQDANSKKYDSSQIIQTAVSEIRDLAYEAEDIVEKYYIINSQQRQDGISNTVKWLSCLLCNVKSLHQIGSDIDELMQKLHDLTSQLQRYGILPSTTGDQGSSSSALSSTMLDKRLNRTYSFDEEETVGLNEDTRVLLNKLVHQGAWYFISISGMGGLGKSTLAKKIYKDNSVRLHFEAFAWVYVSQQFQESHLLRSILKKLCSKDDEEMERIQLLTDDMLHGKLHEILQKHKCLVVLDDIWHVSDWNLLKSAFCSIKTSYSKLLVTTREQALLSHMDPEGFLHQMQCLASEASWELFQKRTLHSETSLDPEMKCLGEQMVNKCKGLPLAIVALSGILRSKKHIKEWKDVHHSMQSQGDQHQQSHEYSMVSQVLELSYNDLPHNLKPCLLYLAAFPEDFVISFERLWHIWEAEGFVNLPNRYDELNTSEKIARSYLNQLVQRSLVQVVEHNLCGKVITCHIHDMMREMCIKKAKEEAFFQLIWQGEGMESHHQELGSSFDPGSENIHRLAIHLATNSVTKFDFNSMRKCGRVRSMLAFNSLASKAIGKLCPLLRVLHLESVVIDELTKEIEILPHLRYLSLNDTRISTLPPTIGKLRFLLTLDLQVHDTISMQLPNELWRIEKLVHLYLPIKYECTNGGLLKVSGLNRLETLINLDPRRIQMKDLRELSKLKRISFTKEYTFDEENLELLLAWPMISPDYRLKDPFVILLDEDMLCRDPNMLARLSDKYKSDFTSFQLSIVVMNKYGMDYRSNMLDRVVLPSSLTVLVFSSWKVSKDPMSILEKLPNLRCFALFSCVDTEEMVCSKGGFPRLEILVLCGVLNLMKWEIEGGAMPKLNQLCIDGSPHMFTKSEIIRKLRDDIRKDKMACLRKTNEQLADNNGYLEDQVEFQIELDAYSRAEENLNRDLLSGKLSLDNGRKILCSLGVSWEIAADGKVNLNLYKGVEDYINSYAFRKWTWDD